MTTPPTTTVIIVAYQGQNWIAGCLESLSRAAGNRLRVCLVDNGGNADAIPKALPWCDYLPLATPRPLGFAEANNFALREAGCATELICFLNQDAQGEPGWLEACQQLFERYADLGAASPLLTTWEGDGWDPGFLDCARQSAEFLRDAADTLPAESQGLCRFAPYYEAPRMTGAALLVRSAALLQTGPFDPIFGSYYEDYDLCRRIREAGWRTGFCGTARVRHFSGSSTTNELARRRRQRQIIRNRAILKFRETATARLREIARYVTLTLPRNLGRGILRTDSSQPVTVQLAAHWDLLKQWRRLVSDKRDRQAWSDYLEEIGWKKE
jgi:N-acetylglucosaminyl-diphospho-decaprenol L-rhamnosyltransferase